MKNWIQPGDTITVAAPTGGANSGDGVLIGSLFGVATASAAEGADLELRLTGVVELPKAAGAVTQGAKVYWDDTNRNVTTTATGNTLIGCAVLAAAPGDALIRLRLNGAVT